MGADGSMARPYQPLLDQVLETLGSHVLSAAYLPEGAPVTVGEPEVHDPADHLEEGAGRVLLAVGSATAELVGQAGLNGYHAVVVKDRGADLAPLVTAAKQAEVALLIAPERLPWRQLDALLTTAIAGPGAAGTTYSSVGMGDLFALANVIASTIGGATCIEDPQGNVLSYSNLPGQEIDEIRKQGILGRRTPQRPTNRTEYGRVFNADGPVRFDSLFDGHTPRLATAVRAGAQLLGFIWVLDGVPGVEPEAMRLLDDAARIAALHLLRARTPVDPRRWHRAETLRALLEGHTSETAAAARLGLPADTPVAVVVFAPAAPTAEPGTAMAGVLELVSLACEAGHPESACTMGGGRIHALLPMIADTSVEQLVKSVTEVTSAVLKSARVGLHAGIGPVVQGLGLAAASGRLAERVVQVLAESGGTTPSVATDEQVRSRIALLDLVERGGAERDRLLEPVRRMMEHDAAHSTTHAASLLAYLDAFGEAAKAAAELSVHENTLRYRVRRLQELFALDLGDPTDRLVVWLQLRLLQLAGEL
ncbi:PucR family transcriptional regulator [Nonomuraea sp. NPDC049714]|uniref:PucR family transcriptional regulator n=1 Tax=Nonomuraea sp. NPDC049714 TaxID=3364357 RepID=UPI0037A69148